MTALPPSVCRAAEIEDEETAEDFAEAVRKQGFPGCVAYVCPDCGTWHAGTPPKPRTLN